MVAPDLLAFLICDRVTAGEHGKRTIHGLFDRITARKFPLAVASFAVFAKFGNGNGDYALNLRIAGDSGPPVFETPHPAAFALPDPLSTADIVITLNRLVFPRAGTYWFHLEVNGVRIDQEPMLFVDPARG
jgi:hypothetical protein